MAQISNEEPHQDPDFIGHQTREVEDIIWSEIDLRIFFSCVDLGLGCSCVVCFFGIYKALGLSPSTEEIKTN